LVIPNDQAVHLAELCQQVSVVIPPYNRRALLFHQSPNIPSPVRKTTSHRNITQRLEVLVSPRSPKHRQRRLDAVHFMLNPTNLLPRPEKGDIRFINNLALLHGREAFEDGADLKEHLVRLWLRNENEDWPLPPALKNVGWQRYLIRSDLKFGKSIRQR